MSRELIADGVEAVVRGHCYDALVGFAGCDKTLPGMMMAMARLNCPSVFVYGGAALPGHWRGRDVTVLDTYEARRRGATAGNMTEASSTNSSTPACPRWARARVSSPPTRWRWCRRRSASRCPARQCCRSRLSAAAQAREAGRRATELVRDGGPLPRELVTRKAIENARAAVAATGGSTNAGLHLPAIAHEAGIRFTLDDFARGVRAHAADRRHAAGRPLPRATTCTASAGSSVVLKELLTRGVLHGDA